MSRAYRFVQVDVFTDRIFGGNQLAVFLEPDGLSDAEMQAIAREMNFAETTFVFKPTQASATARVRIFTPWRELPFAGHPTVGTAWVLANRGAVPRHSRTRRASTPSESVAEFALEEGIGLVPVRLDADGTVWMSHRDAEFGPPLSNRAEVAASLGLTESDLLRDAPIVSGSTGVQFLFVPLNDPQTVDRAQPNLQAVASIFPGDRAGVFIFAPDRQRGVAHVYSRMFAPDIGVAEDAATGSASGPLGAYVAERGILEMNEPIEIVSLQGYRMGRPSTIRIRLDLREGRATNIQVGGGVVPVLEGELQLPE
ncbi:MAG: PhzF family phenazine biosynthesis protein [Chloroflexi bacterium]|nr:PhzF family phenazine biosynthesis protein [Chloroflexota bacterium]